MSLERFNSQEGNVQTESVLLGKQETLEIILPQLLPNQDETTLSKIESDISIVDVGNVHVILISDDHDDTAENLNPFIAALATSPQTSSVVVEYLYDEVKDRVEKTPFLSGYFMKELEAFKNASRFRHNRQLADLARQHGKQVVVADPANSPLYESYKLAMPIGFLMAANIIHALPVPEKGKKFANAVTTGVTAAHLLHRYQRIHRKGIFDENKIHELEDMDVDIEDARRLFIAENLLALAQAIQVAPSLGNQIVVRYPQAHTLRIIKNMLATGHSRDLHEAKKLFYKCMYPGIETPLRIY